MKIKSLAVLLAFCFSTLFVATVQAQNSGKVLGVVNGGKIYTKQLDDWVKNAVANGATDSPELRKAITEDLVVREAILQDIKKTGLANTPENDFKIKMAQQNILLDLWFADYFKKNPITDQDVKAEYDRELALSKDPKNANEYKVSQIIVGNEKDAEDIINKLNLGSSFETLAKDKSLDKASAAQGGSVNWALAGQFIPPVGDAVMALSKGSVSSKPIKTQVGFVIVRLDDVRKFRMPSFDEAKGSIAQAMVQQRKQAAVAELMKKATVTKGN